MMWGQIVTKDLLGGPISAAKLNQTTASAVTACDAADGVTDGIIDDPRTCHFSATANICGAPTAPATNCLTPLEARTIDMIWDGPRNQDGQRIWFGLDPGTNLTAVNGTPPFFLGVTQFHWDEHDLSFDWHTVSIDKYPQVAQDGSRNIADVTDTFGDLDVFRRHGGKLLTFVGGNDQARRSSSAPLMPRTDLGRCSTVQAALNAMSSRSSAVLARGRSVVMTPKSMRASSRTISATS